MPRQLRLEYRGAIYHVMNRGDRREPIFAAAADHRRFLATLGQVTDETGWQSTPTASCPTILTSWPRRGPMYPIVWPKSERKSVETHG
jgi:hypothetical protein